MYKMLSLIASVLLFAACGEKIPTPAPAAPEIKFASQQLTIDPEGGEASMRVSASAAWTVTTDGQDWYALSSSAQIFKGESLLKVSAQPNVGGSPRQATLRFTSGESTATLTLSQAHFVPELSFAQTEVTGPGAGGEVVVKTTANAAWTVEEDDDNFWFSIPDKVISKGEDELKIRFNRSYTAAARSASVRFTSGDQVRTLTIKQEPGEPVAPGAYVPAGYELVWQDDFSGSSADIVSKWRFEDWAPGRVNHELQRYLPDDRRTSFVQDGALNIVARKDGNQVISARMNSRESWLYGYVEAAIRLPKGKGTWPAFWMMPDDQSKGWPACGEIDIMEEVGVNANYTSSSIHCHAYNHVKGTQKTAERLTPGAENEYHVYALEWTEDYIRTYVDGERLLEFKNDKAGNDNTWPFNKKFFIILNLAWGGDWGGWNGVDESALPCTMQVDYVRVYKK
ncbi:MAG: family 16 glycosylhydrolase [Bacteroidales bacterium]|nr:family 16 glycosylhydrolase [Bacteroidales bacterium]